MSEESKIDSLIDRYLEQVLQGGNPDLEEFLRQHPELSDPERARIRAVAGALSVDESRAGDALLKEGDLPFEQIGLNPNLSKIAYPEYTKGFLYGVPVIFVLWPAMLAGMSLLTQRAEKAHAKEETEAHKEQKTVEEKG